MENGGFLATIESEDQRKALQEYYLKNEADQPKSYFLAALNFLSGSSDNPAHAWWVRASDEEKEGHWVWIREDYPNVTDASWFFFGRGLPDKPDLKFNEFGDDDCAMIVDKQSFLR